MALERVRHKLPVRKGDTVRVVTGVDKGKEGRVVHADPWRGTVLVQGVNVHKRHRRRNPNDPTKGGIQDIELPLAVSKVRLVCPHCKKLPRVRARVNPDGSKGRVCSKCGEVIS